jgi:zinc protease
MTFKVDTQRWVLSNGLIALYRQDPAMPLAAGTLLLRAGSRYENPDEAGVCNFMFEMLLAGTRHKNVRQIADVIESIGGSLGAQAAEDYSELDWLVPAVHAERVFDLMAEVLIEPTWPVAEIAKQRRHILMDLKTRSDGLFNVAYDAFRTALFKAHPYARPVDGTAETVKKIGKKELAAWHAQHIRPEQAIFSLAGPWPVAQARRLIEKSLGRWGHKSKTLRATRSMQSILAGQPHMAAPTQFSKAPEPIHISSSFQQAYIMTGTYAPALTSGGILPLKLWNMILGGGMSSRLFVQLREERGLAYEVSSFYPARLDSSAWAVYMGLPVERLPEAEKALHALLEDIVLKGPTAAELEQAKQLTLGTYVMDHQTRRRQAWYAAWWEFLGRPTGYDHRYLQRITAVSMRDVRAAGRALLEQPRLTVKVIPGGRV